MQVADAPSSLTGFFLYAAPDYASEIDIEVFNHRPGTVLFSTYAGRAPDAHRDAARWVRPDGGGPRLRDRVGRRAVRFTVDGVTAAHVDERRAEAAPMNLYANAWFPSWLDGLAPAGTPGDRDRSIEYRRR